MTNGRRTPRVEVLLSTYNGARYLEPLVESILRPQTNLNIHLLVRDDGSTDLTPSLLAGLAREKEVEVHRGENVGPTRSFFRLLEMSDADADFVAFADQDDVWLPDKIPAAVTCLESLPDRDVPALYCARATITDKHLNPRGLTPIPKRGPSMRNALVQNIATGCTVVLNKHARTLLLSAPWPQVPISHDRWFYLVLSALGTVIYDKKPRMLYRQHESNTLGVSTHFGGRLVAVVRRRLLNPTPGLYQTQATEFLRIYGDRLSTSQRRTAEQFAEATSAAERLLYVLTTPAHRQRLVDDLAFRVLFLLRWI